MGAVVGAAAVVIVIAGGPIAGTIRAIAMHKSMSILAAVRDMCTREENGMAAGLQHAIASHAPPVEAVAPGR